MQGFIVEQKLKLDDLINNENELIVYNTKEIPDQSSLSSDEEFFDVEKPEITEQRNFVENLEPLNLKF